MSKITVYGSSLQTGIPAPSDKKSILFLNNPAIEAWDGTNASTISSLALAYTLRAIGENKDKLEIYSDGSGKLTRIIKTGALNLNSITPHPSGDYGFTDAVYPKIDNTKINAISDSFVGVSYDNRANNIDTFRVASTGTALYFRFAAGTTYTLEEAKALVNAATTYWVLNTPEITNFPIGTFSMIYTQNPNSVIYSTPTANLEIEYYVDVDALVNNVVPKKIFSVKKDGTGDFTNLVDAVNIVSEIMDAVLYVGDGTWDIISELGSAYVENVSSTQRGLVLKNRIHIICSSKALITCKYVGVDADTREWLSAFNAGINGFTLENARIETDNIRYSVHDERDSNPDQYKNSYINCKMKHTNGFYTQCIGGGLGLDGNIIIKGCKFTGDGGATVRSLVSYHNSGDGYWTSAPSQNAQSTIKLSDNYFSDIGRLELINFGNSQKITEVLINGNSFGAAISHINSPTYSPYENIQVTSWNNTIRA
jgi:hypothetical protein